MYAGSEVKRETNPRENTSLFKLLTFLFTFQIFRKYAKPKVQQDDIHEVLNNCCSSTLGDRLETEWKKEKLKSHPALTNTVWRMFGKEYMLYGMMNFIVEVAITIINPYATGKLVSYFTPDSTMTEYDAYCIGILMTVTAFTDSTFVHYYLLNMYQIGLRLRISLCSLMYRKVLKLTTSSLTEVTNGRIVTMMSKDSNVFTFGLVFMHDLWVGLIKIVILTYIMYREVQFAAIIGVALLVLLLPVQFGFGVKTKNLRLKTSKITDDRLRRIQEILTSIKLIKLYTWEKYYTKITNIIRNKEMDKLRQIYYLKAVTLTIAAMSDRISFFVCILVYGYFGGTLTAEKAFVVITCYGSMHRLLTKAIPLCISQLAEAKSSFKRIKQFLLIDEFESTNQDQDDIKSATSIVIKNAKVVFFNKTALRNINWEATPSLIGVTGAVGSGKSTFLKMILKDVNIIEGSLETIGSISYASQEPWLFPGSIRQNILFGLPYDKIRYQNVIRVCALLKDLDTFSDYDRTVVTDNGLNFSKGQQARINLARAVYKNSDIYLLDDVLSALDSKVSKYVFEECIQTFLKDKLCVLVCHNRKLLERMDRIVVFHKHTIKSDGDYNELSARGVSFGFDTNVEMHTREDNVKTTSLERLDANVDENCKLLDSQDIKVDNIYEENKKEGKIDFGVYKMYFKYAAGWMLIILLAVLFAAQALATYFDYFVKKWVDIEQEFANATKYINIDDGLKKNPNYEKLAIDKNEAIVMYVIIIVSSTTLFLLGFIFFFGLSTLASKRLHSKVFERITGARMLFFDQTLSGNILNRFSLDMGIIDELLPYIYYECIRIFMFVICVIALIAKINLYVAGAGVLLLGIMVYARSRYLSTSRNLRRLEAATRAPMVGYLNSSLEGITTIRARNNQDILKMQFDKHQDLNSSASYMSIVTSRAFGYWLDILSCTYITILIFTFIILKKTSIGIGASDVGLAVTQSYLLTLVLQWGIRQWAEIENLMVSVERVLEYTTAIQENKTGTDPDNWPLHGRIEYRNVSMKYYDNYVLNNVNFVIEPKQKVGIIGRTGAGKSSIISALFRLYDIQGSVIIDGVDIKDIELEVVRSKIAIIPQDPVLFEGTIRTNLDPLDVYTDLQIWNALGEVELKGEVEAFDMGLSSYVREGGVNFSIGQRQLICLARAILRNNKILVLDEATANIDPQTDLLIQKTVKRLFADCTVLTIAHRLNTVINSDQIILVDDGRVIELDDPLGLLDGRSDVLNSVG